MKTYISLTTIQGRQQHLIATLKSLLNQTKKPDKIYVHVSEEPYLLDKGFKNKNLGNKELSIILEDPLFEVVWTENTGPYRKLLPALERHWDDDCCIITVDDDCNYSDNIVEDYVSDYLKHDCVISYRGFTPVLNNNDLNSFKYFNRAKTETRSLYNFPTGLGGIIYHPKFFEQTKDLFFDKELYTNLCQKNDDIWFYINRIKNNVDCLLVHKKWSIKHFNTKSGLFINYNSNKKLDPNTQAVIKTHNYLLER